MIKSITISVEEDNGSTMQHTVSTKEEALALIDRYFPIVKIGDKVRILTDGYFAAGSKYIGGVYEVKYVYEDGTVKLCTGMHGASALWSYEIGEYELVKECRYE
ncbi:hypothetical protein [Enterococcus gallinarum]|uniref:hypothetical protein n=1 Tax=Enterococcus gallinarum TaxID=1353 RepID=UPI0035CC074F